MKKFIIKLILFLFCVFIIDNVIGYTFEKMYKSSKGGYIYNDNYIADKANEDIIIMGSSRANHHYIPSLFKDSLNMSCYNAGFDGMGIILMYGRYKMLVERYTPPIIIYDISNFDLIKDDKTKYLKKLKPYHNYNEISNIISSVDYNETVKMNLSKTYKYNSIALSIINSLNANIIGINGYHPLKGTMEYEPKPFENKDNPIYIHDGVKLNYLENLIKDCQGKTKLFFAVSPFYFEVNNTQFEPIKELCKKYNIPFFDHANDTIFIGKKELFKDRTHLNEVGAEKYTQIIIEEIKKLFKNY